MTCEQLTDRILSSTANIDSQAFRTGRLNNSDWNDFAQATSLLYNAPIYMDDSSGISVPEIKAKIRTINQDPKKEKIGLVIIDYLQLMQSAKRTESRVQEISDITRNLKIMAKELNVPVIALSQLSRAAEKTTGRSDHRPQLSDLRDSGSIEQDADIVLFLYRAAYYNAQNGEENQANENEAECIVAKNRHGETSVVRLGWDGAHTRFSNLDVTHESDAEKTVQRMDEALLDNCRRQGLFKSGDRVIAACSGGADSMALLLFLLRHRRTLEIEVLATHVNHGIRGETAAAMPTLWRTSAAGMAWSCSCMTPCRKA